MMRARILSRLSVAVVMLASFECRPALAQENDPNVSPENVDKLPASRPIVEYALAGGVLLGALAIGFMPSKRVKDA